MLELIIDSGGTKSDWVLLNGSSMIAQFTTEGMNPVRGDIDQVLSTVSFSEYPDIAEVHFYGAGCSSESLCKKVSTAFSSKLPDSVIRIETDLLAAARALCQDQPGIIGILGTGSSICRYDRGLITDNVPSGGYLIGDEGSGFCIGQAIIRLHLRGNLSSEERQFVQELHTGTDLLTHLYSHGQPNALIASFSKSLSRFSSLRRQEILKPLFCKMIEKRLIPLNVQSSDKIYFVGSIAFHYQKELQDALNSFNLQVEKIASSPIEGLIQYHIEHKL